MVSSLGHDEGRIPFRVRVGVTGHREIEDPDAVAALVRERIEHIRDLFPPTDTTPVEHMVVSSLAEGADRLVVHVASDAIEDVALDAVLPLPADDYARDFSSVESGREFEELLTRAVVHEMPPSESREEAYERAGRHVVDHSDVVLALWDGRQAAGRAGTAEIVAYARRQGVPVWVVPTTRSGHPAAQPAADEDDDVDSAREAYARIVEFNRPPVRSGSLRDQIEAGSARLGQAVDASIESEYERVAEWALPRFVRADSRAITYQRRHYGLGSALYLLAALAVTTVAAQTQAELAPEVAFVEVGLMLILLATYAAARRMGVHERWLGYRSLAEAFRSALFMAMAGTGVDPEKGGADDRQWYQRAFSEAWGARPLVAPDRATAGALRRLITEGWIDDQIRYHEKTAARLERGRRRLTGAVFALFGLTVVAGLLHALEPDEETLWPEVFVFLALALPAFGAALTGIRDQRQYRIHAERSRRTAARLRQLRSTPVPENDLRAVPMLAARTQAAIESEKSDWWGVSQFQEVEMLI